MFRKYILFLTIAAFVVIIDQLTKAFVSSAMSLYESIVVVGSFFNITYIRNPGAAFGFLATAGPAFRSVFFLSIPVAAILLILYYLSRSMRNELLLIFSLSLILGGASGNLIDRIRYGEVVDFLDVYIASYHWPIFNVADASISLGAALLVLQMIRDRSKGEERHS